MSRPPDTPANTFRFERFPDGEPRLVAARFSDVDDAVEAARILEERGYEQEQISVFMSSETRDMYLETHAEEDESAAVVVERVQLERENRSLQGAGAGGLIGGALGAVGAAIGTIGTALLIPPLGIAIAGPVVAVFAGAGAGAAAGGIVGALAGAGMSEYRARRFEEAVREGHVIVGVTARTLAERHDLVEKLEDAGGEVIPAEEA